MGRKILAVVAGFLVVAIVVSALQAIGASLHPLPEGVDPTDPGDAEALAAHLRSLPLASWLIAWCSELLGAGLGGFVAGRVAPENERWFAGGIVALALVGSILNWISFPHPAAFIVGQLIGYPLVLWVVFRMLERGAAPEAPLPG